MHALNTITHFALLTACVSSALHAQSTDAVSPTTEGKPTASAAAAPLYPEELQMRRESIRFPEMADLVSHTILVPDGWKLDAKAARQPMPEFALRPRAAVVGTLASPTGAALTFYPAIDLVFTNDPEFLEARGGVVDGRLPLTGEIVLTEFPGIMTDVFTKVLVPQLRPKATNIEFSHTDELFDADDMTAEMWTKVRAKAEASSEAEASSIKLHYRQENERAMVTFEEGGITFEEEFDLSISTRTQTETREGETFETYQLHLPAFRSVRAKEGSLEEALPLLLSLGLSLKADAKWPAMARTNPLASRERLARAHPEIVKMARAHATVADRHPSTVKTMNAHKVQRAMMMAVEGIADFKLQGDGALALVTKYRLVYINASNELYFTDNPYWVGAQPEETWHQITKVPSDD